MIFKDQRPRKNLNTLTPSNYSLNKQCSRWWHQKVGCLCSRLKFETNLETQTSFQTRAMFMQRNKGLSFFVPQRRSPLFHCNKAAPTTTKYWPPHYIGELASHIYIYIREHIQNIGGDMIRRKYVGYVVIIISFALL